MITKQLKNKQKTRSCEQNKRKIKTTFITNNNNNIQYESKVMDRKTK